jgi:hypothetical protein
MRRRSANSSPEFNGNPRRGGGRALVLMLLATALTCEAVAAGPGAKPLGSILGWGAYAVDRMPSPPGTLVFPGDVVTTEAGSGVEIRFASGGIARLEAATEVAVSADALELRQGSVSVRTAGAEARRVHVIGASVTVEGANSPSLCRLAVANGEALVAVEQGAATIRGAGAPTVLTAGHAARIVRHLNVANAGQQQPAAPPPQSPAPAAPAAAKTAATAPQSGLPVVPTVGRVVGVYPDVIVRHPGAEIATPLRLGELVDAGDVIGTLDEGRARVQLYDDTLVDAGLATTITMVAHDPAAHKTELRLKSGHLRAEIPPLEVPVPGLQPQFVVRSEVLDVTAAPTTFFFSIGPKETTVCNVASGLVTISKPGAAPGATVKVGPGECSVTQAGEAPSASHPDMARMERMVELTSFENTPALPELARREGYAKAHAAVDSGAAVLSLVALIEVPSIPKNFNPALDFASSLSSFLTQLNNTVLASQAASEAEHQLCLAFLQYAMELGKLASPSSPAQACPDVAP